MLHEIISVLLEEGAEVIDVAHINVGDKIIYIIKSQLSIGEILNEATSHIHQLQRNRERLKRKKTVLKGVDQKSFDGPSKSYKTNKLLITNLTTLDSLLEVNLVSPASNKNFMLHEIISVLQEEGAEVIDVAHINVGDKIIYIIKSQV
ncbi:hypothetical protein Q3G72_025448 [Acer saccharum]|nr:hypothetical protein Q3G72_025448 [Acer saccharum]